MVGEDEAAARSNSISSEDRLRRDELEDDELLPGFR